MTLMRRINKWVLDDPYRFIAINIAMAISLMSFAFFYTMGVTLEYGDAVSHLMITRRTIVGLSPGWPQLGTVWPPLPHILMLPFVANDWLYSTGIGGSIPSMFYYVGTVVYVYRLSLLVAKNDRQAAFLATMAIALNLNLLYMQATPMTEPLLLLCFAAACFYLRRWVTSREVGDLVKTGLAIGFSALTRYEGWVFMFFLLTYLLYLALRSRWTWGKTEGNLIMFLFWPAIAVGGWMVNGGLLLGNVLSFQNGDYAKPSNWVQNEVADGHFLIALKTYVFATAHVASIPGVILGVVGLVYFVYRTRLDPEESSILVPLFPLLFFPIALFMGQRPMHVPEISGDSYNERFALQMLLPIAFLAAYLARTRVGKLLVGTLVVASVAVMLPNHIVTLNEPIAFRSTPNQAQQEKTALWFSQHYDGESLILMENYGNEVVQFPSRVLDNTVYEGTYRIRGGDIKLWGEALKNPAQYQIEWIYARKPKAGSTDGDKVYQNIHAVISPMNLSEYKIMYEDNEAVIYRRTISAVSTP